MKTFGWTFGSDVNETRDINSRFDSGTFLCCAFIWWRPSPLHGNLINQETLDILPRSMKYDWKMFVSIIKAAKIVNVDPLQDDKIYPEARHVLNINDINILPYVPFWLLCLWPSAYQCSFFNLLNKLWRVYFILLVWSSFITDKHKYSRQHACLSPMFVFES